MRTKVKKLISLMLSVVMVLAIGATLMADDTYTIEIKKQNPSDSYTHSVTVYQVFKADVQTVGTEQKLYNITWPSTVDATAAMSAVTALTDFSSCTSVADIVEVLTNDPTLVEAFAEAVSTVLTTSAGSAVLGPSDTSKTVDVTASGTGYYLVTDSITDGTTPVAESKFMLDVVKTTTPLEITTKEVVPTLDKKIVEGTNLVGFNEASVGELITFQIKSKVPDLRDKGYNEYCFVIKDTLSKGLTYSGNTSLKITIGGNEISDYTCTATPNSGTGETDLKIVFEDFIDKGTDDDLVGEDIVVTYTAYLNSNAVLTDAGNPNTASLVYSNDPSHDYSGDEPGTGEPTGETPKVQTITYTTGMQLVKVDMHDNTKLAGAIFKVTGTAADQVIKTSYVYTVSATGTYYRLKNGTYTTDTPTTATEDLYESTSIKYALTSTTSVIVNKDTNSGELRVPVDADGVLHLDGLGAGTYEITEVQAPTGYVGDTKTHKLEISCTFGTDNKPIWTYKIDNVDCSGNVLLTVQNEKMTDLPRTGGIGTTAYYVSGSVLLLAGVVICLSKKRKNEEK